MIEVHDLEGREKTEPPRLGQALSPVDEQHHLASQGQAPAQGVLAQSGTKFLNRAKTGDVGGGFIVSHRVALGIGLVLGKDAAQVGRACASSTRSEIVVPVFDVTGRVRAVLDVDSDTLEAFDETDARHLEDICRWLTPLFVRGCA